MNYKVKAGDTLSKIAKRNGISLAQLLKANPQIKDPDRIQIGQIINLPDTSTETTQPLPSKVVPVITAAAVGAAAGALGAAIASTATETRRPAPRGSHDRAPNRKPARRHPLQ